ncbi:MAG: hypothetical protein GY828_01610 [Candidatus Gracilibacteria bacterium]|nr:hypothetical protein [Candidatus Gracilibacteria bacterium]
MTFACMVQANEEEILEINLEEFFADGKPEIDDLSNLLGNDDSEDEDLSDFFGNLSELLGEDQPVNDDFSDLLSDDDESESEDLSEIVIFDTKTDINVGNYAKSEVILGKFRINQLCNDQEVGGSIKVNLYFNPILKHYQYSQPGKEDLLYSIGSKLNYFYEVNYRYKYENGDTFDIQGGYVPYNTDISIVLKKSDYIDYDNDKIDELLRDSSHFGLTIRTNFMNCQGLKYKTVNKAHNEVFSLLNEKIEVVYRGQEGNNHLYRLIYNGEKEISLSQLNLKVMEGLSGYRGHELYDNTDSNNPEIIHSRLMPYEHSRGKLMPIQVNPEFKHNANFYIDSIGFVVPRKKFFFKLTLIPDIEGEIVQTGKDGPIDGYHFRIKNEAEEHIRDIKR